MREVTGDIWDAHDLGHWIAITTNGIVRRDGACVMGRGVAREAALRLAGLPLALGRAIRDEGNRVHAFPKYRVFSFPVKHHWREPADPDLILRSAEELVADVTLAHRGAVPVYLVRPGCGNGGLQWSAVKPLLAPILDDRFIIVERAP